MGYAGQTALAKGRVYRHGMHHKVTEGHASVLARAVAVSEQPDQGSCLLALPNNPVTLLDALAKLPRLCHGPKHGRDGWDVLDSGEDRIGPSHQDVSHELNSSGANLTRTPHPPEEALDP